MDLSQYRDLFVSESRGHLRAFGDLIIQLEGNSADRATVDELFRHAHSMKGMAATMRFLTVADLAHHMEDLLAKVRGGEAPFSAAMADLLLDGCDTLSEMVMTIESGGEALKDVTDIINRLGGFTLPENCMPATSETVPPEHSASQKSAPAAPSLQLRHEFRQSDSFKSVRIRTEALDRLVNITGELITTRYHLVERSRQIDAGILDEPLKDLSNLLRALRDEVFQARMLPFGFAAERFPRLVRDLARKQGKEVSLQIDGREIELDRGILEEITEPLIHILRNAVDHGLEMPDERSAAGKPPGGTVSITVIRDKDHADIVITDDGRGMEAGHLTALALKKGLISPQQAAAMLPHDAFMLICLPGFSTAAEVSDISGRGVGMDAVRTTVHALGGALAIESERGAGSRFNLRLPITVSIIHAVLATCGTLTLAFPVGSVNRTTELSHTDIRNEEGRDVCSIDGRTIPLKDLNRILGQPDREQSGTCIPAIITEAGDASTGLLADRLLGQQEIFVKPLKAPLSRMRGITGGAILGDGRIVFVIDSSALA